LLLEVAIHGEVPRQPHGQINEAKVTKEEAQLRLRLRKRRLGAHTLCFLRIDLPLRELEVCLPWSLCLGLQDLRDSWSKWSTFT
jgi:hypothetical protein